jgi:8-oxo-dGTP pyrophosphatase MutT (NUDIX family)
VARHEHPFDRGIVEGHLTGSAVVVSAHGDRVLLLHHRKLDRWLQPGGHGDPGETNGHEVALREALEETGIAGLALHPQAPRPLDVDVHDIPARGAEPAHQHLDLRYLVVAPEDAHIAPALAEMHDLRWFGWHELDALGPDAGLRRALSKARALVH